MIRVLCMGSGPHSTPDGVVGTLEGTTAPSPSGVKCDACQARGPEPWENEETVTSKLADDMAAMQAILDTSNATLRDDPAGALKDIARAVRRLDRKVGRILDGTN